MEFRPIISALILIVLTSLIIKLICIRKNRFSKLFRWWRLFSDKFHDHQLLHIPEFNDNFQSNDLFHRVHLYLNSLESLEDSDFTNLLSGANPNDVVLTLNSDQTVVDRFLGAQLWWKFCVAEFGDARLFSLKIRKRDKKRVLRSYLQHIWEVSDEIDRRNHEIRLFIGGGRGGRWRSVKFTHPATMDTVAIDSEVKNKVERDIDTFLKSRDYYHRVGRVWRRSYLLYGPSGTGKSSFVAALAKKLSYDVYDFDLSRISDDVDLKFRLLQTTPKSVILIEDFDKFVAGKTNQGSFSGVMNFMDGVVNSCCDERILVFTTTSKDEIDPAILRPGRVDVHIQFSMCDFNNFKILASNYLGVKEHKLFSQVEEMFSGGITLSPAEIRELLMVNRNSPNRAIKSVISALQMMPCTGLMGGGVGEDGKETPKNGFKAGRVSVDRSRDSVDGGNGVGFRDGAKELRKLYSLLRRKNSVSKSGSFDLGT